MSIIISFIRSLLLAFKARKFFSYYVQSLLLGIFYRSYKHKIGEMTFGRTPLDVYDFMASHMQKGERFCDLGSGDGLGMFYINSRYNNPCIGIELIEDHFVNAMFIKKKGGFDHCHFYLANFNEMLVEAEAYYLTATCMEEETLHYIAKKLEEIQPRIVFSLSAQLVSYGLKSYVCDEKKVIMPWGEAVLYVHRKL